MTQAMHRAQATLYMSMRGKGGMGKRARGSGGLVVNKDTRIKALKESIGSSAIRLQAVGVVQPVRDLLGVFDHLNVQMNQAPDRVATDVLKHLSVNELTNVMTAVSTSHNPTVRLAKLAELWFKTYLEALDETTLQVEKSRAMCREYVELVLLIQFGSDEGTLAWSSFTKAISETLAVKAVQVAQCAPNA